MKENIKRTKFHKFFHHDICKSGNKSEPLYGDHTFLRQTCGKEESQQGRVFFVLTLMFFD